MVHTRRYQCVALLFSLFLLLALGGQAGGQAPLDFDAFFENKTMRVDYVHSGGRLLYNFSLDQIVSDGRRDGQ